MRIITGTLRGRIIPAPKSDSVRPTSDRTKESIFSRIEARKGIQGDQVLDLFAGSGNLGFEAISRGAKSVVAVENDVQAVLQIKATADKLGITDQVLIIRQPVEQFISGKARPYDLILADPPYDWPMLAELPDLIINKGWLEPEGWLVLEHDKRHRFENHPHCVFSKPYGRTVVSIFFAWPVLVEEESEDGESL